ncbi:hypothetical protein WOLCODRAFT_125047 [Wolfiporia cocos MD-104 SS10]|uniref:SURP motif domain-containing protein n=1 Tax=Wolfiporia cocos (strain MD-104) TaxID=742152 RepID=A0A2H3JAW2_WOLCO|nr:hypothetical protein WOLCODRAFT_125047 [Wolfiporia cocos MD-104 SS10]
MLCLCRYDARLLLDALPIVSLIPRAPAERPSSPGGWSDLPSDAEDTFFFSPGEVEDYRRAKRRRLIDQNREARLRALRAEADDDSDDADAQEEWGGSDEEPDDAQRELMRRTVAHILASPNPAQLEMRILANHGADGRFAFLRGRWARAWRIAKGRARVDRENEKAAQEKEKAKVKERAGLGGLAGYGDSDSGEDGSQGGDGEHERDGVEIVSQTSEEPAPEKPPAVEPPVADDDAIKQARRARARMWAERRREMKPEMAEESPGQ